MSLNIVSFYFGGPTIGLKHFWQVLTATVLNEQQEKVDSSVIFSMKRSNISKVCSKDFFLSIFLLEFLHCLEYLKLETEPKVSRDTGKENFAPALLFAERRHPDTKMSMTLRNKIEFRTAACDRIRKSQNNLTTSLFAILETVRK